MKYKKLGDDINIPKTEGLPLWNKRNVKFNYYLSSRINGNMTDLDITSKIFDNDAMYIRKSCYRVQIRDIENCVKNNTIEHMKSLGMKKKNMPESLMPPKLKTTKKIINA
ncbi:MAG: hypothetical protein WB492_07180 [Christiangramia sp.]